jgi:hypothetical protein
MSVYALSLVIDLVLGEFLREVRDRLHRNLGCGIGFHVAELRSLSFAMLSAQHRIV